MTIFGQLPVYSFPLTFLILSGILVGRYFLLAGAFYFVTLRTKRAPIEKGPINGNQIKRDIKWSVLSSFVFALSGSILIELWRNSYTQIYLDFDKFPLWYIPLSFFIYLFIHDTYFYWTHRFMHVVKFKECHFVHHESRIPTAWTSFSFHPYEACIQAIILPCLVILVPIHWSILALFLLVMSICGVLNHLGFEFYPQILEKKLGLISASHHQIHHGRVNLNYGLYFTWWDKLMKTECRSK